MKLYIQESDNKINAKSNLYRVWYNPYMLDNEEDYIEVNAVDEKEARRKVSTSGRYVTYVELVENIVKESIDIMSLPTSERVELMIKFWNDPNVVGSLSTEKAMRYWERKGFDTSNYTSEEFNRVWDLAQDELDNNGYIDEEDDYEEEIETKEDAYNWLQNKLREYGNTYHFNNEDRYKLDRLIDRFGNTYFWNR